MVDYEDLKCPCGHRFDVEAKASVITYWGQDGPKEMKCSECEQVLIVMERVTREYEVSGQ